MSDIDAEVAAFAAEIDGVRIVDPAALERDATTILTALIAVDGDSRTSGAAAALALVRLRDEDRDYAQLVATTVAHCLAAHICLGAASWEIARYMKRLNAFASACHVVGLSEGSS